MTRRESGQLVRVGAPTHTRIALTAARLAIGAEVGRPFSNVLREPIPNRMAELLKLLDQPIENDQDKEEECRTARQYLPANPPEADKSCVD
jgi:hypothetical protein